MSDDKRREELKVRVNEKLEKLSIEELEKVAGGFLDWITCPKCEKTFIFVPDLSEHSKSKKSPIQEPEIPMYECPSCGHKWPIR